MQTNSIIQYGAILVKLMEGNGVERDTKKKYYYWELAAMEGHAVARHNLGVKEARAGNMNRALKHAHHDCCRICTRPLEHIKLMFMCGDATKDDYEKALHVRGF